MTLIDPRLTEAFDMRDNEDESNGPADKYEVSSNGPCFIVSTGDGMNPAGYSFGESCAALYVVVSAKVMSGIGAMDGACCRR